MKKQFLSILLLLASFTAIAQTPDIYRAKPAPASGSNANNQSIHDANLAIDKYLRVPHVVSWTLNGGKDSAGVVAYNKTLGKFGVYAGGGVWQTFISPGENITVPQQINFTGNTPIAGTIMYFNELFQLNKNIELPGAHFGAGNDGYFISSNGFYRRSGNGSVTDNGVFQSDLAAYLKSADAASTYQPKGNYLTGQVDVNGTSYTIVKRDDLGQIFGGYFNTRATLEDATINGVFATYDTYIRKVNAPTIQRFLNLKSAAYSDAGAFQQREDQRLSMADTPSFHAINLVTAPETALNIDKIAVGVLGTNALHYANPSIVSVGNSGLWNGQPYDGTTSYGGLNLLMGFSTNNKWQPVDPAVAANFVRPGLVGYYQPIENQRLSTNNIPSFPGIDLVTAPENGLNIDKIAVGVLGTNTLHYAVPGSLSVGRSIISGSIDNQSALFDAKQNALGFTPVQQGTGVDQSANIVKIGWSSAGKLKATVDVTALGNIAFEGIGLENFSNGNTRYVQTESDPTVSTFGKTLDQNVSSGSYPYFSGINVISGVNPTPQSTGGQTLDGGVFTHFISSVKGNTYHGAYENRILDIAVTPDASAAIRMFGPNPGLFDHDGKTILKYNENTATVIVPNLQVLGSVSGTGIGNTTGYAFQVYNDTGATAGSNNTINFPHGISGITSSSKIVGNITDMGSTAQLHYRGCKIDASSIYLQFDTPISIENIINFNAFITQ